VLREKLIAALPTNHRLARARRPVDPGALAQEGFILFPRALAPGLYDLVIAVCRDAGFVPRVAQEAVQMQTILGLTAAGLGVALVPACMANLRRPDVAYLPLRGTSPLVETCAVWRADDESPVLRALLAELAVPRDAKSRGRDRM
jgi:DNA-binding transcriptional LysR family regulator